MTKNIINIKGAKIQQIKRLKKDLISKAKSKTSIKELNKIIKGEIDELFERKIRETLLSEYNFKKGNIKRHFFIRTLTIDKLEEILLIDEPKSIKINNKRYVFLFNKDKTVTIAEGFRKMIKQIISNKKSVLSIETENIEIGNLTEIEFDGSF